VRASRLEHITAQKHVSSKRNGILYHFSSTVDNRWSGGLILTTRGSTTTIGSMFDFHRQYKPKNVDAIITFKGKKRGKTINRSILQFNWYSVHLGVRSSMSQIICCENASSERVILDFFPLALGC